MEETQVIEKILIDNKVNSVVDIGLSYFDKFKLINYCEKYDADLKTVRPTKDNKKITVTQNDQSSFDCYDKSVLESLEQIKDYDAIFINDDANWYAVYNQLKLVEKNNRKFPLTFIMNYNQINERRDSYKNPEDIPEEYRHICRKEVNISLEELGINKRISFDDNLYHAIYSNTAKNGLLTAVEDFINDSENIQYTVFNSYEKIILLYDSSEISSDYMDAIDKNLLTEEELYENYYRTNYLLDKMDLIIDKIKRE